MQPFFPLLSFEANTLDTTCSVPLYQQLYQNLRRAILQGDLPGGTRLPSTRTTAIELGVSRNTVLNAFEQLMAEGYLEGKAGSGTWVTAALPEAFLHTETATNAALPKIDIKMETTTPPLSQRGVLMTGMPITPHFSGKPSAFRPGLPALDQFPHKTWERLFLKRWRSLPSASLSYGQPAGYLPLREAVATYLAAARGVKCQPEQVLIVSGAQQAIDLAARILLDPGQSAWIEDPGYGGARVALLGSGINVVPVPVAEDGLDLSAGIAQAPHARLVYISPSHQYPLGVTMSLRRRQALLQWAEQNEAWILEDDYDSEYRYSGRPIAALQGLDQTGRVIYVGTFSKVLFPGLRLGYMVVPSLLVDAFSSVAALTHRCPPIISQAVVADFITEGHFTRHIRRMRKLYSKRQAILVEEVSQHLAGLLEITAPEAGLHTVGWLPPDIDQVALANRLKIYQVQAPLLSSYAMNQLPRPGLVLGYAAYNEAEIRAGVQRLAQALNVH